MNIVLSSEQQAAVDAAVGTTDNLLISACAGGAKTTTMCAIAKALGPGRRVVALAFNKDAAENLKTKMPYWVESTTFHSFCNTALSNALGRVKVDPSRCKWILKDLVPDWKTRREIESDVLTLVSRFKSTTASPQDEKELTRVAETFDIEASPSTLNLAKRVLEECLTASPKSVDFDDMLWLTFHLNVPFQSVAVVLLDEAQDTNGVQRALLARMVNSQQATRLIAVGDPHQSIYGFRGADHNAMEALKDEFNMTPLALSVSWRCSQAVVTEAQKYL
jgi:superfamily I DNA/RNA helicase